MSRYIYALNSSNELRDEYRQQMEAIANAHWMEVHGEGIDTGFDTEPPSPVEPRQRTRVLAPSIVPGLDWMTGGPYRSIGPDMPTDVHPTRGDGPSDYAGNHDDIASITVGEHIGAGAHGYLLPSLIGGVFSGAIAASRLHGTGLGGVAFASRLVGNVALGVATGAGVGLLVAASSPKDGDSLGARYAVAGGLLGAAGGAAFPGGTSRAFSAALGAVTGAVIAGFTGARLESSR